MLDIKSRNRWYTLPLGGGAHFCINYIAFQKLFSSALLPLMSHESGLGLYFIRQ